MKLTRSQKAYVGILALAVAGLGADRLLHSGLSSAPSASLAADAYQVRRSQDPAASTEEVQATGLTIALRLRELADRDGLDPEQVDNAFRVPDSWHDKKKPTHIEPNRAELFRRTHQLTSILLTENGGTASVGERVLGIGDELEGFRLVELRPRSAVFQCGQDRVELTVSE